MTKKTFFCLSDVLEWFAREGPWSDEAQLWKCFPGEYSPLYSRCHEQSWLLPFEENDERSLDKSSDLLNTHRAQDFHSDGKYLVSRSSNWLHVHRSFLVRRRWLIYCESDDENRTLVSWQGEQTYQSKIPSWHRLYSAWPSLESMGLERRFRWASSASSLKASRWIFSFT